MGAKSRATGRRLVNGFLVRMREPTLPLRIRPSMLVSSLATLRLPLRDRLGECAATFATYHALPAERVGDFASFMELTGDAEAVMLERRFREGERGLCVREEGGLWYEAAGKYARSPVEECEGISVSMWESSSGWLYV